jgi:DNA-binding CsgD family transcriptional regulator
MEEAFLTALDLHAQTPDVFETARTQLAYGSRLRRARRRVEARPHLQAALAAFDHLGARPWAAIATDELEATGATVPRHGESGLATLTPRERQIVTLLLQGRTIRAAAGALFLSPRTVEYHLRHVYTKLGVGNRRELTDLLSTVSS